MTECVQAAPLALGTHYNLQPLHTAQPNKKQCWTNMYLRRRRSPTKCYRSATSSKRTRTPGTSPINPSLSQPPDNLRLLSTQRPSPANRQRSSSCGSLEALWLLRCRTRHLNRLFREHIQATPHLIPPALPIPFTHSMQYFSR